MANSTHAAVLLIVSFKTSLSREEMERRYKERLPQFRALPGLLQQYYVHDSSSDQWGGVYLWDSHKSLDEYMASDLRRSIPDVYQIVGTPRLETLPVVDILRP